MATLPMACLQAETTQNDLVSAFCGLIWLWTSPVFIPPSVLISLSDDWRN
jgi:hypothetical protein